MKEGVILTKSAPTDKVVLRDILERVYSRYNHRELIEPDPLQFVYRYSNPADQEIAGFLAAALAYGRVQQIEKSVADLLARMGASPYEFVRGFDERSRRDLRDFKHRFTSGDDISDLLWLLGQVLAQYGSIEKFFAYCYNPDDSNTVSVLSRFCGLLCEMHAAENGGNVGRGLRYLLADPTRGSASKRLNLFLRWMVRSDDVDPGLWKSVEATKLIVPVDVHMGRLARILGLHNRNTVSLATALEITAGFAAIEPSDPVKYDFALSRIGIVDDCNGKYDPRCEVCELSGICVGN
ncbi:MAG: TIGR02757 family protein [Phycisphaerales bacterium]|nr:MAG: TIGR02757 family protein [Phycisphaerales bacterium]